MSYIRLAIVAAVLAAVIGGPLLMRRAADARVPKGEPMTRPEAVHPRGPKDRTAWRALAVAAGLGVPATLLMGLIVLLEGVQHGLCAPDHTCGGLPGDDMHACWLVGGLGFAVSVALVIALDRVGQREVRWVCALAAPAFPVLTMVVAVNLGHAR